MKQTSKRQVMAYFPAEQTEDYERTQKFFAENPHIPESAIAREWLLEMLRHAEKYGIDPRTLLPKQWIALGPNASTDQPSRDRRGAKRSGHSAREYTPYPHGNAREFAAKSA